MRARVFLIKVLRRRLLVYTGAPSCHCRYAQGKSNKSSHVKQDWINFTVPYVCIRIGTAKRKIKVKWPLPCSCKLLFPFKFKFHLILF